MTTQQRTLLVLAFALSLIALLASGIFSLYTMGGGVMNGSMMNGVMGNGMLNNGMTNFGAMAWMGGMWLSSALVLTIAVLLGFALWTKPARNG